MSDALGGSEEVSTTTIRSFDMVRVIETGVDLTQFRDSDYSYNAHLDVIFVRVGSPLFTWISMKL